jgi:hypothetical protein
MGSRGRLEGIMKKIRGAAFLIFVAMAGLVSFVVRAAWAKVSAIPTFQVPLEQPVAMVTSNSVDIARSQQQWKWPLDDRPQGQTVIVGRQVDDGLGEAIATGDVNGDGFEDLIIGARFVSIQSRAEGEVYVLPGPLAFGQTITMPQQAASILQGATQDSQLGVNLDSGDLNGDGYTDIVAGTWSQDYVYLGSSNITKTSPLTVTVTPDAVALTILHPDARFAVCNLNGDGYDDLILESPQRVRGILGNAQLSMTSPLTIDVMTDPTDFTITMPPPDSWWAPAHGNLGCGDVDGDGYNDLVIGVSGESPGGRYLAGRVYVIRGSSQFTYSHPITIEVPSQADAVIEGIDGGEWGRVGGDGLGHSVAVADVNGDSLADLLLGAPGANGPNNSAQLIGESYLWLGRELHGQIVDLSTEVEWVLYGDQEMSRLGCAIQAGDFDNDSRAEALFGCVDCNKQSVPPLAGGGYVVDAEQVQGSHGITQVASLVVYPSAESASIGIGGNADVIDLDADGYDDLILTAGTWGEEGRVFVLSYPVRYRIFLPISFRQSY